MWTLPGTAPNVLLVVMPLLLVASLASFFFMRHIRDHLPMTTYNLTDTLGGLEFSLAACAILLATGSVGAAIALDPAAARRDGAGPPPVVALPVLGRQSAV